MMEPTLYFRNPTFKIGTNVTCRRGIKWSSVTGPITVSELGTPPLKEYLIQAISTRVFRFSDLTDGDVANEHDPECRTYDGLYKEMRRVYPGFDSREIVTLVSFEIPPSLATQ
jgi:hypothetical protein